MDVVDRCAEAGAVAEMVVDQLGPVIDRDEDVPKSLLDEVAHDGLERRPATDMKHRLRHFARQHAQALAQTSGHDQHGIFVFAALRATPSKVSTPTTWPLASSSGSCLIDFSPHQAQAFVAGQRDGSRDRARVHHVDRAAGQRDTTQQSAPDIAVGDDPGESAVVEDQSDLNAAALDGGNRPRSPCASVPTMAFCQDFMVMDLAGGPPRVTAFARSKQLYRGCERGRQSPPRSPSLASRAVNFASACASAAVRFRPRRLPRVAAGTSAAPRVPPWFRPAPSGVIRMKLSPVLTRMPPPSLPITSPGAPT